MKKLICLLLILMPLSCLSPKAVNIEAFKKLEDLQELSTSVISDKIDKVDASVNQTNKLIEGNLNVQGGINFGGAWTVMLSAFGLVIIFVIPIFILAKKLMERNNSLKLVTCSVQKLSDISRLIKNQIEKEVAEGKFSEIDKQKLANFVKKNGNFASD